ncbi:CAP domain-containing protein [Frankia sp. CNm7]|uniref:CAP domain-containing protein n=1 Tax=Frankia nepalensis TaxID=1836974 RepID=A0A937UTX7_9ACTN|nr:CAP domain-containing protein [Frankia nepalensis]MBL7500788.1 CAP domain-containing protein [Frankia nepalensis]MBL7512595.1 CAP domain-containing protein [Frankia nepalensis]MBL7519516.1 CAP domain-containing protein [Frankia nepalensis]MBL7633523.1 CAP domain-containing protein [Frankia nepalensis]
MTRVPRNIRGPLAAVGVTAVLTACQPFQFPSSGDGGAPRPTHTPTASPTSIRTTTAPPSPTHSFSPTSVPPPPTTTRPASTPPRTTPPAAPTTRPPVPPPPATTPPAPLGKTDEVVRLTNVERGKAGCGPLAVDASLTTAAQAHTADMAANNYFSHTSRDGRSPGDRAKAAGFPSGFVGENIAAGAQTPAQVLQMWMDSAGHRANILNCSYTHIGVGYAEGGSYRYYWTQAFGRR